MDWHCTSAFSLAPGGPKPPGFFPDQRRIVVTGARRLAPLATASFFHYGKPPAILVRGECLRRGLVHTTAAILITVLIAIDFMHGSGFERVREEKGSRAAVG